MKIKEVREIISGARNVRNSPLGIMWFRGESTELNGIEVSSKMLFLEPGLRGGVFAAMIPGGDIYEMSSSGIKLQLQVDKAVGYPKIGELPHFYVMNKRDKEKEEYIYRYIQNGEVLWTRSYPYRLVEQFGDYALLWSPIGRHKESACQLIELATGAVLWELDYPGAYIKQVYPYEDKVIIVWFPPMGKEDKSRVLCVEVPSGKIIWENREPRHYQKYGNDKLVFFYSSLWEDGYERGDNHQLAELDVQTGAFQMYKFPGYNTSTYVTTVYKDYLFYGTLNYYFYVGAIDLRTHEMLPEVKIDYTPGNLNRISSIGVHEGQLYVEIQTELDHSDIHVLDLDEDECSAGKKGISMGRKIRICTDRSECCYPEHSTAFYANLYELLKDPSRVEQLVKEGYAVFDCLNHRIRALDMEFLEVLQDHFLELERKGELYTPGSPEPHRLFLWQPGVTSKLLAQSTIEVQAVLGPHTIRYEYSIVYMNVIYCDTRFIGPEEKEYLIERYGAPTYTEWREEYGLGEWYIIIPVEDVDKLVAVERFLALDDTDERPVYTGEERVYELDLRAPEESVYKYFLEREIILEYDPENFAPEYLYPPLEEEDTEEQRPKGRYLPAWLRSLCRKVLTLLRGEDRG